MNKKYQIGIYVDLPKNIAPKIARAKKFLYDLYHNDFTQDPHITLYLSAFKKQNFENLCGNLRGIFNFQPFSIQISPKIKQDGDFYYLSISPQKPFCDLQKIIIKQANRSRGNLIREKDLKRLKTNFYSKKQASYVNKYGCMRVFDFYEPHITLGNIKNSNEKKGVLSKLKKFINFKTQEFLIKNITVTLFEQEKLQNPLASEKIKLEKKIYQIRESAGGYIIDKGKILLVKNLARGGAIGIPKGRMEKGEVPVETAHREIAEETGYYDLRLIKKLPSDKYIYQLKNHKPTKQTLYQFLFKLNSTKRRKQSLDMGERLKPVWISLQRAKKTAAYIEMRKMIGKIRESIEK